MIYLKLNNNNLSKLSKKIIKPTYDRSLIRTGILHFGLGNFHRSHQAYYVDQLLDKGIGYDWGICGVSLLPQDKQNIDSLKSQNGLYTIMIKELDGSSSNRNYI